MSGFEIPLETMIGIIMLLVGGPYVFREKLRRLRLPRLGFLRSHDRITPYDVLQLVERADCPQARQYLVAALNCLLEKPDAADD